MKKLYTLMLLVGTLMTVGCADDKGSYEYAPENAITIGGLKEVYQIVNHEAFSPALAPELSFELGENADLSYSWRIDYDNEICTNPTLDVPIHSEVGTHPMVLIVTDNKSSLKYYYEFTIEVETPYSRGLAVLSEMEDGTAKLSFQQRSADGTLHDFSLDVFETNNPDWGSLGEKPVDITLQGDPGIEGYPNNTYYLVLNGAGDKYLTVLDINTMKMKEAFSSADIPDCPSPWEPQMMETVVNKTFFLANGKCFTYDMVGCGRISAPQDTPYELGWITIGGHYKSTYTPAYDDKTKQFVYMEQLPGRDFTFDKITPYNEFPTSPQPNPIHLDGLTLIAGERMFNDGGFTVYSFNWGSFQEEETFYNSDDDASTMRFIFKDAVGNAHFYTYDFEIAISQILDWWTGSIQEVIETKSNYGVTCDRVVSGLQLDENTAIKALPYSKYWLIANGRNVVREFWQDGAETLSFTLPTEVKGNIVKMLPTKDETKLFVAVYDSSSSDANKGGIAVLNLDTKNGVLGSLLEYYPNVCGKAVKMIERTGNEGKEDE